MCLYVYTAHWPRHKNNSVHKEHGGADESEGLSQIKSFEVVDGNDGSDNDGGAGNKCGSDSRSMAINDWGHRRMRGALRAAQKAISQMSHFWIREVRSDLVFARCQDLKCLTTITASAVQRWKPSSSTSGEVVMVKEECELNVLAIFFIAHMIAIIVAIIVYLLPIRGVGEVQVCPRCEVIVSLPIQSSTVS